MFELGFWHYEELQEVVTILFQKLENLNLLEKSCYVEFEQKDQKLLTVDNIKTLKDYFSICKESVAAICVQIIVLMNDNAFENSHHMFSSSLRSHHIDLKHVWRDAFFHNTDIANILLKVLTTYLLKFREPIQRGFRQRLFKLLNDFMMIITDPNSDAILNSARIVTPALIHYYKNNPVSSNQTSVYYKQLFVYLLDKLKYGIQGKAKIA